MNCAQCGQLIEFDYHGSIELQFHYPSLAVECHVFCGVTCIRGWLG